MAREVAIPLEEAVWLHFWSSLSEEARLFTIARLYLWFLVCPADLRLELEKAELVTSMWSHLCTGYHSGYA